MGRFFDMDSPLFVALGRLADFMILNLLFILTSIPIFTIGASCTALSYMTLKMVRNEETYIAKGYFKSFKENLKQSTIIWLICLILILVFTTDFRIAMQIEGTMGKFMKISLAAVILLFFMGYVYIFPVLSKFYNSCKNTVKNSYIMAVANLPFTIGLVLIDIAAVVITFLNQYTIVWGLLIWVLFGFSVISYLNSKLLIKVFDKYIPEEEPVSDVFETGDDVVYEMSAFQNLKPQKADDTKNSDQ